MQTAEKPSRADEIRQERRRKRGSVVMAGQKLGVDESKLDRANYTYRWAADTGHRMTQLHGEDWDVAPENATDSDGEGTVNTKLAGTDKQGKPYSHVLVRKRKDWYDADKKEKQAPLDAMDKAIREGVNHIADEKDLRDGVYTPGGRNIIERR
jgi:hypothetical protein